MAPEALASLLAAAGLLAVALILAAYWQRSRRQQRLLDQRLLDPNPPVTSAAAAGDIESEPSRPERHPLPAPLLPTAKFSSPPRHVPSNPLPERYTAKVFPVAAKNGYLGAPCFPEHIGPFKLMPTNRVIEGVRSGMEPGDVVVDFDANEWRLTASEPLSPVLTRLDKTMQSIGGLGSLLSPFAPVNLNRFAKNEIGIPAQASYFAWSYPVSEATNKQFNYDPDLDFLMTGGFLYLDDKKMVCALLALSPERTGGMRFGDAEQLQPECAKALISDGRFHDITLPVLREQGATHFCWISPKERVADHVVCPLGGFAYIFEPGQGKQ